MPTIKTRSSMGNQIPAHAVEVNGVLHGHSVDEMEAKERGKLIQYIKASHEAYHLDHFIVSNSFCCLFTSKSLIQRLNRDHDSLQCWLWSFNEAVATQKASTTDI